MPRMIVAVLLLLLTMGQAVAGPPEKASGSILLDEVWDGLRHYRAAEDERTRAHWLWRLAPTQDPRVAVALGESLVSHEMLSHEGLTAGAMLLEYYLPANYDHSGFLLGKPIVPGKRGRSGVEMWWLDHEAELRRCAKQLPQ